MRALLAIGIALLFLPAAVAQAAPATQPASAPDWSKYQAREDLAKAGDLAGAKRVLRFVQVSDAHILDDDAPYPLRQEPLDPFIAAYSTSAQRPQEEYTDEVLDSIVRAINAQHAQDPLQFVMNTGDNVDNDLENELMRFLDLYDGTSSTHGPISGFDCLPDGQSSSTTDASQDVTGSCTSLPVALAAAHGGLAPDLPWYSAFGNHDGMIQGNVNIEPSFETVAGQVGRYFLHQDETVSMYFPGAEACPAGPAGSPTDDFGHGYGFAGDRLCDADLDNDAYYAFSVGAVRFIVLDTVNDDVATSNQNLQGLFDPQEMFGSDFFGGFAEGSLDPAQVAWMESDIAAHPDSLVLVFSHHTLNSMLTNAAAHCDPATGQCLETALQQAGYETAEQVLAQLSQHPNVVAWIGGHTHRNHIEAKVVPGAPSPGLWNIESSSLIDWPQQARSIELWVTADGAKAFFRLTSFSHDVATSRQLEATDQQRDAAAQGEAKDRDTLLWVDLPTTVKLAALPDVARQWRVRVADPGRHGVAGQPFNVTFLVDDLLHLDGPLPPGVNLGWSPFFTRSGDPSPPPLEGVAFVGVGLPSVDRGNHLESNVSFTPDSDGTYYAVIEVAPPNQTATYQLVSVFVDPGPVKEKQSPGLAPLGFLAALGLALAVLRRR